MLTGSRGILGRMQYGNWLRHFTLCTGKLLMFSVNHLNLWCLKIFKYASPNYKLQQSPALFPEVFFIALYADDI